MEEIIEYLKKQQAKWLCILNERYETDGGTSLVNHAKGHLTAYTEILAWIEKQTDGSNKPYGDITTKLEEQNENTTRETRGTGKQAQTDGGSPL